MIRMERDKKTLSKSEWRMSEYDDRESKNKLIWKRTIRFDFIAYKFHECRSIFIIPIKSFIQYENITSVHRYYFHVSNSVLCLWNYVNTYKEWFVNISWIFY